MALDYIFPNDFPSTIQFIFSNYFSDSQGRFARRRYCQECGKPSKQNNLKSSSKSVYGQFSAWVARQLCPSACDKRVSSGRSFLVPKRTPLSEYVTAAKFILLVMHFAKGFTPNYTRVARASSCSQK